ncbi:MAG: NAD kinase [Gammaproteobacteria bacterium]|nr:NAD kinase [Gammaproteobacteria bacterium]
MSNTKTRIAFVSSNSDAALGAMEELTQRYGNAPTDDCDVIVALGGDGFVLHCLHDYLDTNAPIYGMNRGTIGFLMNAYDADDLPAKIAGAQAETLHPLTMSATSTDGTVTHGLAFNEVSLLRSSRQSAKLKILVDGKPHLDELICDGVLVATPAGSTAYNLSVHGPVVPLGTDLVALTSISAFRPRRWRGALLPSSSEITIENLDPKKRPISGSSDHTEVHDIASITISEHKTQSVQMLFDKDHSLNERILREQFAI